MGVETIRGNRNDIEQNGESESVKTDVENRLIWLDGKIVNIKDATVNILSPTAQFGLNVFEGIRCYWNEEKKQLFAFRLDDHHKRLQRSIKLLQLDSPYSLSDLKNAFIDVVKANDYREDIAVRQTVFVDGFGSWGSEGPVNMFLSPIPKAKYSAEYNKKSLRCCISSWRRISDSVLSPRIKCGANYINSRMAQREALRNGYDTTIFLNDAGKVAEGPGSCLFIVKNGTLITPLLTDSVLESITRDTIIKIARDMGIETIERSIDRTELYTADEAFLCGSAMEITPVCSVDKYTIMESCGNKITDLIYKQYMGIVLGRDKKYESWLTEIYESE
nr:branched-chain amino acid transaminase [uncultured Acetatifactor sp.]